MVNPLALSDEDFMNQSFTDSINTPQPEPEEIPVETTEEVNPVEVETVPTESTQEVEQVEETSEYNPEQVSTDVGTATEETASPETPVDYKALYEQVTAPFKANGKTISIQSVEEATQLMQMGANYTKKMQ